MPEAIYETLVRAADFMQYLGKFPEARILECVAFNLRENGIRDLEDAKNAITNAFIKGDF